MSNQTEIPPDLGIKKCIATFLIGAPLSEEEKKAQAEYREQYFANERKNIRKNAKIKKIVMMVVKTIIVAAITFYSYSLIENIIM